MTLLDASTCETFCTTFRDTVGSTIAELVLFGATAVLVWWRARKAISKVAATAQLGIDSAHASAKVAKAEARDAHLQLAELRGSLRPISLSLPPSAGTSGLYTPVTMPSMPAGAPGQRPAIPDPSVLADENARWPPPSRVPEGLEDVPTRPGRAGPKGET